VAFCAFGVACLGGLRLTAAQQVPAAAPGNFDSSQEPFILEEKLCKVVLEKDGTSTEDVSARVRVQSQTGAQEFGLLKFPYASASSSLELVSVRVRKPGGRVVETPKENVLEMPADITRQAPFYSDLKEMHVAVKGLEVGDTLEYQYRIRVHSPLDPRQFWEQYDFFKLGISLKEELQLWVPRDRYVKVYSPRYPSTSSEQGAYRVYTWKTARLENKRDPKPPNAQEQKPRDPPDVLISTFRSWEEVGAWFRDRIGPRAVPTPEVRAKAEELTRGAADEKQKTLAIYNYVSQKVRYIGVALGVGRYQPHAAAEVLANDYGDCKDKHTLLAALLAAAGVPAGGALVNSAVKIDPEVPSPGQFDHVVSVLARGSELNWMDTTIEVAPFGFLVAPLRRKQALYVPAEGPARLVETPPDPPFLSVWDFQMDGKLDDAGTFTGKAQIAVRGDLEILLRLAFRQAGPARWNEVMQAVSGNLGFGGKVSEVTADPPEATDTAFHIRYQYVRETYGDWPNRRVPAPLPAILLPEAPAVTEKNPEPLDLGTPTEISMRATMKLPEDSTPQLPRSRDLNQEFATFHSSTTFSEATLRVERLYEPKVRAIEAAQFEAYRKFRQSLLDEWGSMIPLRAGIFMGAINASENSEAQEAFEHGQQAMQQGDPNAAIRWFQSAVKKDPEFAQAWLSLGNAHYGMGMLTNAAQDYSKLIALDRSQISIGKAFARELVSAGWRDDALVLWRAIKKADPKDAEAPKRIGALLLILNRYSEALAELEAAEKLNSEDAQVEIWLGHAYLRSAKKQRALPALQRALEIDTRPAMLNNVAYLLAENDAHLEEARTYAEKAVAATEKETETISLELLGEEDVRRMDRLYQYWDTLGWVYFKMGRLDSARSYLIAAWNISQDPVVGDHLGQVLAKQGRTQEAARSYARAAAAGHAPAETMERLVALRHSQALATQEVNKAREELGQLRSVKLPRVTEQSASADFYVLFVRGAGPKQARFLNGAESLRGAADTLTAATYDVPFPDDAPTRIVRRGTLSCERTPPGCQFVLIPSPSTKFEAPVPAPKSAPSIAPSGPWTAAPQPLRPFQVAAPGEILCVCETEEGISASRRGFCLHSRRTRDESLCAARAGGD